MAGAPAAAKGDPAARSSCAWSQGLSERRGAETRQVNEGLQVIRIEPQELTLPERQDLVRATAGAWADDPSTDVIFAALLRERCADVGRDVRFDDPA